jgi:hypothetical protein
MILKSPDRCEHHAGIHIWEAKQAHLIFFSAVAWFMPAAAVSTVPKGINCYTGTKTLKHGGDPKAP